MAASRIPTLQPSGPVWAFGSAPPSQLSLGGISDKPQLFRRCVAFDSVGAMRNDQRIFRRVALSRIQAINAWRIGVGCLPRGWEQRDAQHRAMGWNHNVF